MTKIQGCVLSVDKDTFMARLVTANSEEEAELDIKMIPKNERKWLSPGAFFSWTIKYKGQPYFRFRHRLWTKSTIERAKRKAVELQKILNW
jgi:hypothetical protein